MAFYHVYITMYILIVSVCFTHPFSITHFVYFRREPVFVKVKIFWPWRVPFLLTLTFLFLLLPFIGPLFCISWTLKESDNRCSCHWLYVCLQESMVSQSFSDHFSWMQLLSTRDFFLLSFFISACDIFVLKT